MAVNVCSAADVNHVNCEFVQSLAKKYDMSGDLSPSKMDELAHDAWCTITKAAFGPFPKPQDVPRQVPQPEVKDSDDNIDSWGKWGFEDDK